VHELATNALKYGALSVPSGNVAFTWTTTPRDGGTHVVFLWKEDGRAATCAAREGRLRSSHDPLVTAREAQGEVSIDYPPDGLVCRIGLPAQPPRPGEFAEYP